MSNTLGATIAFLPLTKGKEAVVDYEDFEKLNKHKWTYANAGYAYRMKHSKRIKGEKRGFRCYLMHRVILGAKRGEYVDHINGNKLDNRRSNIRLCTQSQNMANRPKQVNNTSGYKGVWLHKQINKWTAEIWCKGKKHYLGCYEDAKDASKAYEIASHKLFGDFIYKLNNSL